MTTPEPDQDSAPRAPFTLVIVGGHYDIGRTFRLDEGSYVIGRTEGADIRLDTPTVGRRHARITVERGRVSIEDLSSPCGLTMNDMRINAAELSPGACVWVGRVLLKLVRAEAPAAQTS
ncbi:FHA domain-containing protein [Polyangium aurulentum]|uniref:FHA domain-containing protein n=1 Tax=Polyangium aurulentum TaxID=2567896 RepID=UPI0010ADCF75|nr:FHA domain-containing protein [Polyangium aurulentum]UQA62804.1 FHA domain-containing protein [Polyangium aurulentum]